MKLNDQTLRRILESDLITTHKVSLIRYLEMQDFQELTAKIQAQFNNTLELANLKTESIKGAQQEAEISVTKQVDPFILDAIDFAKNNEVSVQSLQQHFKIDYKRAVKLLAELRLYKEGEL